MRRELQDKVFKAYREVQHLAQAETVVSQHLLDDLSDNWQDGDIPALQRKVVDMQLDNLRKGYVDPVFAALAEALKVIELTTFTLLDAACATGYYAEVIKTLDKRDIRYKGCDYSEAMVRTAQAYRPDIEFDVQDLTQLSYPDRHVEVVLISGVLEHIPDYKKAIAEACRVAKSYLIIHRCPLTAKHDHIYTIGSQYNISTPRIYFARQRLIKEVSTQEFQLIKQIDINYRQFSLYKKMKLLIKGIISSLGVYRKNNIPIKVQTLVFKRN